VGRDAATHADQRGGGTDDPDRGGPAGPVWLAQRGQHLDAEITLLTGKLDQLTLPTAA
jgi:hypothetical protein